MATMHMYQCFICILAAFTAFGRVQSLDTGDDDLKHRLSVLEETVLRVVERNNDLTERNNYLEERNNRLEERNSKLEKRFSAMETDVQEFKIQVDKIGKESCTESNKEEKTQSKTERSETHTEIKMNNSKADATQKKETYFKRQSNTNTIETVAFTAVVRQMELQNLGAGQTIIYDEVITNVGGSYHSHTGIFIAPFNGVYVFNFAEMITAGHNEYLELVKNGQHVMWNLGDASGAPHFTSSSRTSTLELKAGDEVWIRTSPFGNHGTGRIHGNEYTTFSGWIVYIA